MEQHTSNISLIVDSGTRTCRNVIETYNIKLIFFQYSTIQQTMEKFEISCAAIDTPRKHDDDCPTNAKENKFNIFLLLVFYMLQFIPIGLAFALPIIIQNMRFTSFKDQVSEDLCAASLFFSQNFNNNILQAVLSIMLYPYVLKILWAPIVDSLFVRKMGRRKSWLIPVQYLLGDKTYILSKNLQIKKIHFLIPTIVLIYLTYVLIYSQVCFLSLRDFT